MTGRLRALIALTRPAVVILLGLFAALGLAQSGASSQPGLLGQVLVPVSGFLLFAVLVNDLADEAVDRVNLPGDAGRALVAGTAHRRTVAVAAGIAGTVALASSLLLPGPAPLVVAGGLALALVYSVPPLQLSKRGAVASLVLPAGYVAVPYLLGVLAGRSSIGTADLWVMAGLYVGFIGRILLKDFRDLRGDALFGKRTFLVRHGRLATCRLSAVCWIAGSLTVLTLRGADGVVASAYAAFVGGALLLLRQLAVDGGARRDERLIAAIAIVGRGLVVMVIGHLSLVDAGASMLVRLAAVAAFTSLALVSAHDMALHGQRTRLRVPGQVRSTVGAA